MLGYPPPPPPGSPAADRLTPRPPRFGSTKRGEPPPPLEIRKMKCLTASMNQAYTTQQQTWEHPDPKLHHIQIAAPRHRVSSIQETALLCVVISVELQPLLLPCQMVPLGDVTPPPSDYTAYSSDSDSDQSTVSFASSASAEVSMPRKKLRLRL